MTSSLTAVAGVLRGTGLAPNPLTLEITEGIRLYEGSAEVLHRLKALGVRLSLDDFGTGYAALTHISTLPIDELRIDRSFVSSLEEGGREAQPTASVVQLGRQMDLEVVAEGVETDLQAAQLDQMGCVLARGYLFARPLAPGAAAERLEEAPGQRLGQRPDQRQRPEGIAGRAVAGAEGAPLPRR